MGPDEEDDVGEEVDDGEDDEQVGDGGHDGEDDAHVEERDGRRGQRLGAAGPPRASRPARVPSRGEGEA